MPGLRGVSLRLALAAFLLGLGAPARAMTPQEKQVVELGMDALYRSDYDKAERVFGEALGREPGNPVYSLGRAVGAWWRMENNFALPKSPEEKAFLSAVDQALDDAKKALDSADEAGAHLYLGSAYGLRGRWKASRQRWVSAYLDGRRAYKNAQKAVALDPELYDAYFGLGAFDYYVASLSRLVRALAFTKGGDKAMGLAQLRLAAEKGRFSRVAAKLLLVGIHWTFEKDPKEAWDILDEVHRQYPGSPLIESMRLLGLFHLRDAKELETAARGYLEKAQRGEPLYQPIDRPVGRCFLGLSKQLSGDYEEALKEYQAALDDVPPGHKWRSVMRLFMGETFDLLGRREEAKASYRQALKEAPLWGVPRYAERLLDHPFQAKDEPLPTRGSTGLQ